MGNAMDNMIDVPLAGRWIGASVGRSVDPGLLRGDHRFVDDLDFPQTLHVCFVRSPHAHAIIRNIRKEAALAVPGVVAVLTGHDLPHTPLVDRMRIEGLQKTPQPALATDRVRFAGEAVAMVLAENRYAAEDGAEAVEVEYDPLPAIVDAEEAEKRTDVLLFPDLGTNVIYRGRKRFGDVDTAFKNAYRVFRKRLHHNRYVAAPMETRGCLAKFDTGTGKLTFWSSTQSPHLLRNRLSTSTGIPEHRIRVIAPRVGGGFGQKIPTHPEELAVALAARVMGRPIKWFEDRRENLVAATHAKEQILELELAVDKNGIFTGLRARIVGDAGAYSFNNASALIEPYLNAGLLPSVYRIDNYEYEVVAVLTNKSPVAPYRGVGWTAGHTARELLIDEVARAMNIDPAELRRRNMIRSDQFPYTSCTGLVYDSGSYHESLDKALEMIGYERLREQQRSQRGSSKLLGIGISPYVEPTGWGSQGSRQIGWPFASHDVARIDMDPSGKVTISAGVVPHGQGHEVSLPQLVADALGVHLDDVELVHSDTDATPFSIAGVRASRTAVVTGGALVLAARDLRDKLLRIAGAMLEVSPDDLELADGLITVRGAPSKSLTIAEVAAAAYFQPEIREIIPEPHLTASRFYDPKATYSNGCIVAVVEVDTETGKVKVQRVAAVEDCGTIINPDIVDGQVMGAVAQGIGGALLENFLYDENGQPLTASFADYLLPTTMEVPNIDVDHCHSPSPYTVGGMKGVGESGLIAAPAAIVNAVADALCEYAPDIQRLPLSPQTVWAMLHQDDAGRKGES